MDVWIQKATQKFIWVRSSPFMFTL